MVDTLKTLLEDLGYCRGVFLEAVDDFYNLPNDSNYAVLVVDMKNFQSAFQAVLTEQARLIARGELR